MLKSWPKNKFDFLNYEEVLKPIKKAIRDTYKLVKKEPPVILYDGYTFGDSDLEYFRSPDIILNQSLKKWGRFKDKSPFEALMFITFWLGVEQGRRFERNNLTPFTEENNKYSRESNSLMDFLRKEAAIHKMSLDQYVENISTLRDKKNTEESRLRVKIKKK